MSQRVFRVHLIPNGSDYPDNEWCIFDLCVSKGIIGVGWPVRDYALKSTTSFEEYKEAYEAAGLEVDQSVNRLRSMRKGDLAWIRDPAKKYYIAEVRGEWEYWDTPLHRSFDILNVRKADIWPIDQSIVPVHIKSNAFPMTVQNIANKEAIAQTVEVWRSVFEGEVVKNVG